MHQRHPAPWLEIFWVFLRLGLTSFGGPVAHLGYFRAELVERRRWVDEHTYADLVALCQFLPGPASSQVGIALGLFRGGLPGALASWAGFTLPSALVLAAFGLWLGPLDATGSAWLHGLKVVAVAVVAQAIWAMGQSLCPDRRRASLAVAAVVGVTWFPGPLSQIVAIVTGALLGWIWLEPQKALPHSPFPQVFRPRTGVMILSVFLLLLVVLPGIAAASHLVELQLFDAFFRAGSLVFGGGHVVLPVLQSEVVPRGWITVDQFLAGYGAAQAVPGPLFTFAAFLGAAAHTGIGGGWGAVLALTGIFLPAFLLVLGSLPIWESARRHPSMQRAMLGINAVVVGLLAAAFYQPVWTSAIHSAPDFALAAAAFLVLVFWKVPPWLVVIACAVASGLGWH